MKKYFIYFGLLMLITGCYQTSSSLIGPAYTLSTTGNIYQAGFTYGTNEVLEKTTGKSTVDHVKNFLKKTEKHREKIKSYKQKNVLKLKNLKLDQEEFFASVKASIEKTRGNLLD